jgi:hypothetical protein
MFLVGLWVGRHGIQADPAAHKPWRVTASIVPTFETET